MASSFITQVASSVPFDNETNGFIAEDTQAAIEEARDTAPGYHAGWFNIVAGQLVTVLERRQSRISGVLTLAGTLSIVGIAVID